MLSIQLAFLCGFLFTPAIIAVYYGAIRVLYGRDGLAKALAKKSREQAENWNELLEYYREDGKTDD